MAPLNLGMLKAEHVALARQIQEIRTWWQGRDELGQPNYGEMSRRVMNLRDCLSRHMQLEEESGFFDLAIARLPEASAQINTLLQQHKKFREMLGQFAGSLARGVAAYRSWDEPRRELDNIIAMLDEHEENESTIFRAAFGEDYTLDRSQTVHA